MNESRIDFLRQLVASPGPSGFEQPVQQVIRDEIAGYSDEVHTDVHGNVIASLHSEGQPRVMLTAHCDEIGFLIRYIDEQGFLYFAPVGGFDRATLVADRVVIQTPSGPIPGVIGRKPIHTLHGEERNKLPDLSEMWIDIGVASREEAQKLVPIGSPVTRDIQLAPLHGDLVVSKALDDRAGIFTVIEAMRRIYEQREALQAAVFFVSAVQEEVGSRGAITSAYSVAPLIAVAVDVTYTSDHPGTSKQEIGEVKLNGGPVITLGGNINPRVYQLLINAATEAGISYQLDPQPASTYTDTDKIQVVRGGIATGLVSIPCRYLHTRSEMASLKDMDDAANVLARFVLALNADTSVIP